MTLFPNPAHDAVTILSDDGLQRIAVYNVLGQQAKTVLLDGESKCTFSTSGFAPGVYVVKVVTGKGVVTQRLIIE